MDNLLFKILVLAQNCHTGASLLLIRVLSLTKWHCDGVSTDGCVFIYKEVNKGNTMDGILFGIVLPLPPLTSLTETEA